MIAGDAVYTAALSELGTPVDAPQTTGIAPLAVQFADTSDGLVTAWAWNFGDGASSTERDPEHVYLVSGSYDVRLAVSGPTGTSQKLQPGLVVVGEPPPTADFHVAPSTGFAPLAVQFSDQSLGLLSARSWSFGDGTSSGEVSPAHVYAAPGSYDVVASKKGWVRAAPQPGPSLPHTAPTPMKLHRAMMRPNVLLRAAASRHAIGLAHTGRGGRYSAPALERPNILRYHGALAL